MKPTCLTTSNDGAAIFSTLQSPNLIESLTTDYNYHSVAFGGSSGRYTRNPPQSFWKIAGNYLKDEARHDFRSEGTLFASTLSPQLFP